MKAPSVGKRADTRRREDNTILALMRIKERGNAQHSLQWCDADGVWWWLRHPFNSYQQALSTLERYATCPAAIFAVWSSGKFRVDPDSRL